MKSAWVLVLASCAMRPQPIDLGLREEPRECWPYSSGHVYAGYPIARYLHWTCREYYEGYSSSDPTLCDRAIVDVQTRCDGVPCSPAIVDGPGTGPNQGARRVLVTPQAAGPLHIEYQIVHSNGVRDVAEYLCGVEPRPAVRIACTVRDAASGAFVPCPSPIPAGTEVHANAAIGLPPDRVSLTVELRQNDELVDIRCANPVRDAEGATRACTWTARPGQFQLHARDGNLDESIELRVSGGPGTAPSSS